MIDDYYYRVNLTTIGMSTTAAYLAITKYANH